MIKMFGWFSELKNYRLSLFTIIVLVLTVLGVSLVYKYKIEEIMANTLKQQIVFKAKGELEAEKETSKTFHDMATTDALTGVRNKYSYSETEAALNEKIKNREIQKLAVAVCDINGLKQVNDTRGHTAGDQLIKDACALICEYFAHGAVFRTGGDEFVVILQGDACDSLHDVISAINRRAEANIKENAVVVAVGGSALEEEDQRLHDVFERADQKMYVRKKELKDMGAKTR